MSCPDCNTSIVLDLPLRLLSIPSLGQISGPLNITWEHRKVLKDVGDAYVQSHISERRMYIPPLGPKQEDRPSRTGLSKSGHLQHSDTCEHHQKATGHCTVGCTILQSTSGICSLPRWTQAWQLLEDTLLLRHSEPRSMAQGNKVHFRWDLMHFVIHFNIKWSSVCQIIIPLLLVHLSFNV